MLLQKLLDYRGGKLFLNHVRYEILIHFVSNSALGQLEHEIDKTFRALMKVHRINSELRHEELDFTAVLINENYFYKCIIMCSFSQK